MNLDVISCLRRENAEEPEPPEPRTSTPLFIPRFLCFALRRHQLAAASKAGEPFSLA